jgi:hypothetical protein
LFPRLTSDDSGDAAASAVDDTDEDEDEDGIDDEDEDEGDEGGRCELTGSLILKSVVSHGPPPLPPLFELCGVKKTWLMMSAEKEIAPLVPAFVSSG